MEALLLYQDTPTTISTASSMLVKNGFSARHVCTQELAEAALSIAPVELIIVFAEIYKEKETLNICRRIRKSVSLENTAMLVAINMYQMPLANRIKELPYADYIFTPLDPAQFKTKVNKICKKENP